MDIASWTTSAILWAEPWDERVAEHGEDQRIISVECRVCTITLAMPAA